MVSEFPKKLQEKIAQGVALCAELLEKQGETWYNNPRTKRYKVSPNASLVKLCIGNGESWNE